MICTFFGHHDTPDSVKPRLRAVLLDLIERQGATQFYVDNHGKFDAMATLLLAELAKSYPIRYTVVLAYIPQKPDPFYEAHPTLLPDGIEFVPPRFAINYRNKWMIERCDTAVTYVNHSFGGAGKCKELALRKKKTVIELGTGEIN